MKKRFFPLILLMLFSSCSFANDDYSATSPASKAAASQKSQTVDEDFIDKSVNIRVNVPGLFVGWLGGVWDIGLSKWMSFGPIVRVFVAGKYSGYSVGLNVNYALSNNLFSDAWILNPYIEYAHTNYDQPVDANGIRSKQGTVVVGVNLMYQWMWKNGLNIMVGVGPEYAKERIPVTSIGDSDLHPHFEVTIGYAF